MMGVYLLPLVTGLNGATRLDFVALTWPDAVYQTEFGLVSGRVHHIAETQGQLECDENSVPAPTMLIGWGAEPRAGWTSRGTH